MRVFCEVMTGDALIGSYDFKPRLGADTSALMTLCMRGLVDPRPLPLADIDVL
jgi:hypothetical protein